MCVRRPGHAAVADPGAGRQPEKPERRRAPLPVFGRLLEPFYRVVIGRVNRRFDAGVGVTRVRDRKGSRIAVISIGNLSVGGTGKTPMVVHVVRTLREAGRRPCIAMRGYRRGGEAEGEADETDAYRREFPGVAIVAQPDRLSGINTLFAGGGGRGGDGIREERPDCVVLDDGFQHRQIARDLDVVLVDATRSPFADRLLPAGWLREPVESLGRASAVVITHAESARPDDLKQLLQRISASHGKPPIAVTRHVWTHLVVTDSGGERGLGLDWLIGKRVLGCCAIGNPGAFARSLRMTVEGSGRGEVSEMITLPDHDPYTPGTVARLVQSARRQGAEAIVVTDKDWSKLRRVSPPGGKWPCPLVRASLALVFDSGREEFDRLVVRAAGGE